MTPSRQDEMRNAIRDAQHQIGMAYEELNALFGSMHDPKDFNLKRFVADAAEDLSDLLERLNLTEIELNNELAQLLLARITDVRMSLVQLQQKLAHINQVIGRIGTVVDVLNQTVSVLGKMAVHLA